MHYALMGDEVHPDCSLTSTCFVGEAKDAVLRETRGCAYTRCEFLSDYARVKPMYGITLLASGATQIRGWRGAFAPRFRRGHD